MKYSSPQQAASNFESAAELFGVLSTPARLRIIGALCDGENNVSQLVEQIALPQPTMSRHLNVLYRAGVVSRRREGANIYYRIADESVARVCKAVCSQAGQESHAGTSGGGSVPANQAFKAGVGSL